MHRDTNCIERLSMLKEDKEGWWGTKGGGWTMEALTKEWVLLPREKQR